MCIYYMTFLQMLNRWKVWIVLSNWIYKNIVIIWWQCISAENCKATNVKQTLIASGGKQWYDVWKKPGWDIET